MRADTLIEELFRANGLMPQWQQHRLIENWSQLVDPEIAERTTALRIENQTLFVRVHSPVLRTQLSMMCQHLVETLNHSVGNTIITQIRLL